MKKGREKNRNSFNDINYLLICRRAYSSRAFDREVERGGGIAHIDIGIDCT